MTTTVYELRATPPGGRFSSLSFDLDLSTIVDDGLVHIDGESYRIDFFDVDGRELITRIVLDDPDFTARFAGNVIETHDDDEWRVVDEARP